MPPPVVASGVLVLATEGSVAAAWPLAQSVYGDSGLRPSGVDVATASVLAGEKPAEGAPVRLRELAEVRAAVRGDDAPSRRILASLARDFTVTAIAVVSVADGKPTFRLFLAATGQMDVVSFAPDGGDGPISWRGAVEAMRPRLAPAPTGPRVEAAAPVKGPEDESSRSGASGSFLTSKWFWGAIVIAGVATAFFVTSRSSGATDPTTIQLKGHVAQLHRRQ
jgi:hypothetical protein